MTSDNTTQNVSQSRPVATPSLMDRIMALVDFVKGLWPVRAFQRYGQARGGTLAGGIAYSALFSVAAALTIGLTVFSYFLGGNETLKNQVFDALNSALPGILKTADNPSGIVNPDVLIIDNPVNLVSIIALLVMLWSAMSMMSALKSCIRAMFGISAIPQNFIMSKLADLAGFVVLAVGFLLGVFLTSAASHFSGAIFDFIGINGPAVRIFLQVGSLVIAGLIDMGMLAFMIRIMAGVRVVRRDLLVGTLLGGIAASIVRYLGTAVVSSVSDNPVLAPFGAIVTLLLWFNLIARIALLTAAMCANPPSPLPVTKDNLEHINDTPNYVTVSVPETLEWDHDPVTGTLVPNTEPKNDVVPKWSGPRAALERLRIAKATEKRDAAQYRVDELQATYDARAREAYAAKSIPSTKDARKDKS